MHQRGYQGRRRGSAPLGYEFETPDDAGANGGKPKTNGTSGTDTPAPSDAVSPPDASEPSTPPSEPAPVIQVVGGPPPAEPTGDGLAEPPVFQSADGYPLQVPWRVLNRFFRRRRWRRPGSWNTGTSMWNAGTPIRRPWAPGMPNLRRRWYSGRGIARPGFRPRLAAIRRLGQLTRNARRIGTLRNRRTGNRLPVFRSTAGGRNYRIVARPRGQRFEVELIRPADMAGEMETSGWLELEQDEMGEVGGGVRVAPVQGRILWPALGFPAVVTPNPRPSSFTQRDSDATRCICVLVVSNRRELSKAEAAQYLRYVPWSERGRRHIPAGAAGSFKEVELSVRNDVRGPRLTMPNRKDGFGEHIAFGGDGSGRNTVTALLANHVRDFYRSQGMAHLHEIRISEAATGRLPDGQYHLFWNNQAPTPTGPSDEMRLLINRFAAPRRARLGQKWQSQRDFLLKEYELEYGGIHEPYRSSAKQTPAEILHPLFIQRRQTGVLRVGHVTDTHVDVRADVYEHNIRAARVRGVIPRNKGDYNNFNKSFKSCYDQAQTDSDILLLTGDLIDYGRGHWGLGQPNSLQEDDAYHPDRNWFLFYYLIASGQSYTKPAYTILGNHDWRLNPYPPFAPGANKPNELLNDHANLTPAEQKQIIATAHGPGHKRGFSYTARAESVWQLLKEKTGGTLRAFWDLIKQKRGMDKPGFPTETSFDSIAWYLLSINPFLDYAFSLPGKHSVLMLDWAKTESVLTDDVQKGEKVGIDPFDPKSASGTPRPSSCLTDLQMRLVSDFAAGPSRAKIVGIHAPVIGPYWDWYDSDLLRSSKSYKNPRTARGPSGGHPLFATRPRGAPYGMTAERGAIERHRDEFIRTVTNPRAAVRMVLAGHIHRNGLYVVYPSRKEIYVDRPKDIVKKLRLVGGLLVRGVVPQAARGARPPAVVVDRTLSAGPEDKQGPLFVTTTSAGPRGSFEQLPLTEEQRKHDGVTTDPGFAHLELSSDGIINGVEFRPVRAGATQRSSPPTRQREMALGAW